jgi:hypothetical protein
MGVQSRMIGNWFSQSGFFTRSSAMSMSKTERVAVIRDYLSNEGYAPQVDDDGDLLFKCEGGSYFIIIDEQDGEFYRLCYPNFWSIDNEPERAQVVKAAQAATGKTKVAKVFTVRDNTWASIELFLGSADQMNVVFKRSMSALQTAVRNFREAMSA